MAEIVTASRQIDGANRPSNEPAVVCREDAVTQSYHYWRGESGQRYLHTVYSLFECPSLPRANYILAYCDEEGVRRPLDVGLTTHEADSLNLADLRRKAAQLGANEVHIHFLPNADSERRAVEVDLGARQLGRAIGRKKTFVPANDIGAPVSS